MSEETERETFYTTLRVQGQMLRMEVDTGTSVSLISEQTWKKSWTEQVASLKSTGIKLRTYTEDKVKVKGEIQVKVDTTDGQQLPLVVVEGKRASLLGRDWLRQMRLDWQTIHEIRTQPSEAEVEQM